MGYFNFSPQVFLLCEPTEVIDIITKAKEKQKDEHELMYMAVTNALGCALDKKYKYKDVFKDKKANAEVTEDEREKMKNFLENW